MGAVLAADPDSPVAVLADGNTRLTAFIPRDIAFRRLANDVLGRERRSEKEIFGDLARALGTLSGFSMIEQQRRHLRGIGTVTPFELSRSTGARRARSWDHHA